MRLCSLHSAPSDCTSGSQHRTAADEPTVQRYVRYGSGTRRGYGTVRRRYELDVTTDHHVQRHVQYSYRYGMGWGLKICTRS